MNLKQRLSLIKKSDPNAISLSEAVPFQITDEELTARREAAVRRHMRLLGKTDAEIDAYLAYQKH